MSEEQEKEQEMRDLLAGISLPGIIGRSGMFTGPEEWATQAYDVAQAMIVERRKRLEQDERTSGIDTK